MKIVFILRDEAFDDVTLWANLSFKNLDMNLLYIFKNIFIFQELKVLL